MHVGLHVWKKKINRSGIGLKRLVFHLPMARVNKVLASNFSKKYFQTITLNCAVRQAGPVAWTALSGNLKLEIDYK